MSRGTIFNIAIFGLLFSGLFLFDLYRSHDRVVRRTEVTGTLHGVHPIETSAGSGGAVFFVRLASGETITVRPPANTPFKAGAEVVLLRRKTEHGRELFHFKSYVH